MPTLIGRRRVDPTVEVRILELKAGGDGILKIGRKLGIGTSVVQRVFKQEPRPSDRIQRHLSGRWEGAMDHGNWQIGQRVSRKDSNELGFVVEVESIT